MLSTNDEEYEDARGKLKDAIQLMETSHKALTMGSEEMMIASDMAPNLREHYFGEAKLDAAVTDYLFHAKKIEETPKNELATVKEELAYLYQQAQKPLLANLNAAVKLYEENSSAKTAKISSAETIIWFLTLAAIMLEAFFIFQPMVNQIDKQFKSIVSFNKTLAEKDENLRLIMNSTRDGLLPISLSGEIQPGASKQIGNWFGEPPVGETIWEFLTSDPEVAGQIQLGIEQIEEDFLPFEVTVDQAVKQIKRGELTFGIEYREIKKDGVRTGLLLVIRDITSEIELEKMEAETREYVSVAKQALDDSQRFQRFVDDVDSLLADAADTEKSHNSRFRALHTIKGNTAIYGMERFAGLVHEVEDHLQTHDDTPEHFSTLASEWARQKALYRNLYSSNNIQISVEEFAQFQEKISQRVDWDSLFSMSSRWRFSSVKKQLECIIKSTDRMAQSLGKKLSTNLEIEPGLRLDSDTFGPIWNNLSHLVRNAVDHGIETPENRKVAGKSEAGILNVFCRTLDGMVVIKVEDDGRGINWDKVNAKLIAKGLPELGETSPIDALMADGVSTLDEVSEISGRGVGMSSIGEAIRRAKGTISVDSEEGKGTSFMISIPVPVTVDYRDLLTQSGYTQTLIAESSSALSS